MQALKQEKLPKTENRARLFDRMKRAAPTAKGYLVDSLAGLTFFTPVNAFNELFIADMSAQTCIKSRLIGIGIGLVVNRPYGIYREWLAKLMNANAESSKMKKFIVDVIALDTFCLPFFCGLYYVAGATFREAAIAIGMALITGTITARPYGWYLDKFRKLFGTKPTLEKE
jgi:hypothetical protein